MIHLHQLLFLESIQLALHLIDFLIDGTPEDAATLALKADLLEARASEMDSFISYNILNVGARMIREQLKES